MIVSDSAKSNMVSDEASYETPPSVGKIVDDSIRYVHIEKDFISLLSSTPGQFGCRRSLRLQSEFRILCKTKLWFLTDTVSYRREDLGSFLIQYIVEVFNTCSHEDDIDELFRKVLFLIFDGK